VQPGAEYGITLVRGTGKITAPEDDARHAKALFDVCAPRFGLKPEDFGRTFSFRGSDYRVTGIAPRGASYPVLAERVRDGRGFKFPASAVRASAPLTPSQLRDEMRAEARGS
jgi:hypothetical protein